MMFRSLLAGMLALCLAGCATTGSDPHTHAGTYPEATPFTEGLDGAVALAAAEEVAAEQNDLLLVIFGANWCHDSRALAGWLETPRFKALTDSHYEVVYIDAGVPQIGEGNNLDLAEELGVAEITGTPTVLVLDSARQLLNTPEDARSWRNTASRSEDEIFAWLESWVTPSK